MIFFVRRGYGESCFFCTDRRCQQGSFSVDFGNGGWKPSSFCGNCMCSSTTTTPPNRICGGAKREGEDFWHVLLQRRRKGVLPYAERDLGHSKTEQIDRGYLGIATPRMLRYIVFLDLMSLTLERFFTIEHRKTSLLV